MDLARTIASRGSEFLLFALTPPRSTVTPERAQEIANAARQRLAPLAPDGLVLYDIDDESDRNPHERPFPFSATLDPARFRTDHLGDWDVPVVVYRAVRKYEAGELRAWLEDQDSARSLTVFVGVSSGKVRPAMSLVAAQELWAQTRPDMHLGGVAIPERHTVGGEEHLRLIRKQQSGCSFFITQVVYDVNAAKDLVSDYRYECGSQNLDPVPIVFTFSVCGSLKTLEFLGWLGVHVPRWIRNSLHHADDTLQASYEHSLNAARDLIAFCREMGVPFGINVESVSNRLAEIEASLNLAHELQRELRR